MDDTFGQPLSNRQAVRFSLVELAWLIAAGAVLTLLRLHAFDLPLETDECNYAHIGGRLLAGDRLYFDVWDHQPFGVFALFAGVIAMFGDAPMVFRGMALGFSLVSLGLLYAIARRCAGRNAAIMAAALFALASSDPGTAGEGCNREIYMNTLILGAWYLALRSEGLQSRPIAASGLLLALASSLKTIVAVHWLLLALWLVTVAWRAAKNVCEKSGAPALLGLGDGWNEQEACAERVRPPPPKGVGHPPNSSYTRSKPGQCVRRIITSLLLFGAAPAVLWLGALAYFAGTDRLKEFVDAVFLFNLGYSASDDGNWGRFLEFFTPKRHPFIFDSALGLWIGGAAGAIWLSIVAARGGNRQSDDLPQGLDPASLRDDRIDRKAASYGQAWALVLLAAASYLAVCLPGRFWPHYYYLLIPALVLCLSVALARESFLAQTHFGVGAAAQAKACGSGGFWNRLIRLCLYGVVVAWLAVTQWTAYASQSPFGITVHRYNSRDFWGRAHGENIGRVTNPQDEIFVYGNEAEIYYYSKRRCASRYTMITGIGSGYPGFERRRATMMEDLRRSLPRLIIVMFDEAPFDEWKAFLLEFYTEPVGWDFHDATGEPIMFVLARKDAPVESIDWNWDRSSVGGWMLGERP